MLLRSWFFLHTRHWWCTSMTPYVVLSHVQYEIITKAPVVKKTSKKLPVGEQYEATCFVGVSH